jgi:hypothetical protein
MYVKKEYLILTYFYVRYILVELVQQGNIESMYTN